MLSCSFRRVLLAIALLLLTESGSAAEKLASCCMRVTTEEITDPITGYMVQLKPTAPCVRAVILQTDKGLFCVLPRAPWVAPKIRAFEKENLHRSIVSPVSPSGVSLLSVITSTASPTARLSASSRPSSSSTAAAAAETLSGVGE